MLFSTMALPYLPDELIVEIISYLCGDDLIELSFTSQQFNSLCNCHTSWLNVLMQYIIISDPPCYNFPIEILMNMNWVQLRSLYINAFKKWDWLIGFWRSHIPAFGGMLHVQMKMSPCRIAGYSVQASRAMHLKTYLVPMFVIKIEKNESHLSPHDSIGNFTGDGICCALYSINEHDVSISREKEIKSSKPTKMKIHCRTNNFVSDHDFESMKLAFSTFLGMNHEEVIHTVSSKICDSGIMFTNIEMPRSSTEKRIIAPGFFAGDYSATHGSEILSLTYDSRSMKFTKISGDRNVRCGAVSMLVDLSHPINYLEVVSSIAKQPDMFNVKKIVEEFKIQNESNSKLGKKAIIVDEALVNLLEMIDGDLTNATLKNGQVHSYIAAFKGRITLGMMPEVENPEYYYHDILAVVTSQDTLFVYIPCHDEYQTGIRMIFKQRLRRLCFDSE